VQLLSIGCCELALLRKFTLHKFAPLRDDPAHAVSGERIPLIVLSGFTNLSRPVISKIIHIFDISSQSSTKEVLFVKLAIPLVGCTPRYSSLLSFRFIPPPLALPVHTSTACLSCSHPTTCPSCSHFRHLSSHVRTTRWHLLMLTRSVLFISSSYIGVSP
jgi:hypothetical protein